MKGVISSSFYPLFKYTRDHCHSPAVCVVFLYMIHSEAPNMHFTVRTFLGRHFSINSFNRLAVPVVMIRVGGRIQIYAFGPNPNIILLILKCLPFTVHQSTSNPVMISLCSPFSLFSVNLL